MGSDMIVALKEAAANGTTLFGLNHHAPAAARHTIQVIPGQLHEPGEVSHPSTLSLPEARQTFTTLGMQPIGQWGFTHGVNEHRVAIGVTAWQSRLRGDASTLCGFDLVRLALQRSHGAHHAVEILGDLLEHHGQGQSDNIFLIADANEAFVLETAGRYWAMLECGHTRVVTDAAMIRQDWRKLAPGLADFVVEHGWWDDDGSKIDFVRCLAESSPRNTHASKRWGHASLALAQQQGAIDQYYLRRMLADYHVQNRDLLPEGKGATLAASFLVDLAETEQPIVAWLAFGAPKTALHFPICLAGELPAGFGEGIPAAPSIEQRALDLQKLAQGKDRGKVVAVIDRLQTKFDQDAEDFQAKAGDYNHHGKPYLVRQFATEMMHQHVELFDKEYRRLLGMEESAPHHVPVAEEEILFFA